MQKETKYLHEFFVIETGLTCSINFLFDQLPMES